MKKETNDRSIYWWAALITIIVGVATLLGLLFGIQPSCSRQNKSNNNEVSLNEVVDETNNTLEEPEIELSPTTKDESNSITQSSKDRELGLLNGHKYIDLGLSVKWATCNVGASKPEDYGQKYAWGGTSPRQTYTCENYEFHVSGSSPDYIRFMKYDGSDKLVILDLSDDVANDCWGRGWRMPTKKECLELINLCTWHKTSINGVKGYRITSKIDGFTDKSIFFPLVGDSITTFWSSSLVKDNVRKAWGISFGALQGSPYTQASYRIIGYPVRPVCVIK